MLKFIFKFFLSTIILGACILLLVDQISDFLENDEGTNSAKIEAQIKSLQRLPDSKTKNGISRAVAPKQCEAAYLSTLKAKTNDDYENALLIYKRCSAEGHSPSQYALGRNYLIGWGNTPKNYTAALPLLKKTAAEGYALAHYFLGTAYYYGKGVAKNYKTAATWFGHFNANNPHDSSFLHLGLIHISGGYGVSKNYKLAKKWFDLIDQRYSRKSIFTAAQYNLGLIYLNGGYGMTTDYKTAKKFFALAADGRHSGAQRHLGKMYFFGQGVPKNNITALQWFQLAETLPVTNLDNCLRNKPCGVDNIPKTFAKRIRQKMTSADISTAKKLVRDCVQKQYKGC